METQNPKFLHHSVAMVGIVFGLIVVITSTAWATDPSPKPNPFAVIDDILTQESMTAFRNLFCERVRLIGQTFGPVEDNGGTQPLPAICLPNTAISMKSEKGGGDAVGRINCQGERCVADSEGDCRRLADQCSGAGGSGPSPDGFPEQPGQICWAEQCPFLRGPD
jgi:hypothetical protein